MASISNLCPQQAVAFLSQESAVCKDDASCSSSQASSVAGSSSAAEDTSMVLNLPDASPRLKWHHVTRKDLHEIRKIYQERKEEFSEGCFSLNVNDKSYSLVAYTGKDSSEPVWFIVLKTLQSSNLANVSVAMTLKRKVVVLKMIPHMQLGKNELEVYGKLDAIEDSRTYCVFGPRFECREATGLILRYLKKGDLLNYYNNVLVKDRALLKRVIYPFFSQMAHAVSFLHKNKIVHLDVKLENFILDGDKVLLADFGTASFTGDVFDTPRGSPGYVDPFFFKKPPRASFEYNPASDCWSLGVCFSILSRGTRFQGWTRQMDERDFDYLGDMLEEAFEWWKSQFSFDYLTDQLLQLNPEKRMTAGQVADLTTKVINSDVNLKA